MPNSPVPYGQVSSLNAISASFTQGAGPKTEIRVTTPAESWNSELSPSNIVQ